MTRIGAHRCGATVGAIALWVGLSFPVAAQPGAIERSVNAPASGHQLTTGRKPARTNNVQRTRTDSSAAARNAGRDAWSINDALPNDSKARVIDARSSSGSQFGRLNLDTGTVGLTTESQFKEGQFADGRRAPGLEAVKRDPPSYFGLSLSVPTTDKSLIPLLPIIPRPE